MRKASLLIMLCAFFFSARSYAVTALGDENNSERKNAAMQKVISGKVTDEQGASLPGATVMFKGTTIATTTGSDGRYKGTKKIVS